MRTQPKANKVFIVHSTFLGHEIKVAEPAPYDLDDETLTIRLTVCDVIHYDASIHGEAIASWMIDDKSYSELQGHIVVDNVGPTWMYTPVGLVPPHSQVEATFEKTHRFRAPPGSRLHLVRAAMPSEVVEFLVEEET